MSSILIVDDESRIRAVLIRWLTPEYQTTEAPDAETALRLLADAVPDVVLCDVKMPGLGGLWLVERLREQFPQVAVVLATASYIDDPSEIAPGDGIEYLQKPFERDEALAAIGRAVERGRAACERGVKK